MAPAPELLRLHRGPDGSLRVGPGPGRGAWLCRPPAGVACLEQARRRRAVDRALRASIPDDEIARLRARLEDRSAGPGTGSGPASTD